LKEIAEIGVPIATFILGWGSGFITALILYRDHERRLTALEGWKDSHGTWAAKIHGQLEELRTTLRVKGLIP
jgi:hypothetical protein